MLIDLPRGAQLPVGSSNIVYRCRVSFKPAPTDIFKTWYANSHPSRAPSTSRKVPLSARPRHRPAVPESSAPGPPPGLRSLVHRVSISAPSSSAGSRSSAGPVSRAHSPPPAARSRSTMGGTGSPRVAHLPGLSVHSPDCPFPLHDVSMCKHPHPPTHLHNHPPKRLACAR